MIKQVPLIFAITCVLFLLLIYAVMEYIYRQRLAHKDDLIASYKEKLSLSPTEKTAALEATVAELRAQLDERNRRKEIREQLSALYKEGHQYWDEWLPGEHEKKRDGLAEWYDRVEAFLRANLGESYATRFLYQGHSSAITDVRMLLMFRIEVLNEIIKEMQA